MEIGLKTTWTAAKSWLDATLSFLYPEVCQYCGDRRATPTQGFVCDQCRKHANYITAPICECCGLPFEGPIRATFACANCRGKRFHFTTARSAVVANGMVLELLHRYKYHHALWVEPYLGELLVRAAAERLQSEQWDLIVPVPLHPVKQQEREFNQAERLAHRLSRATQIPVCTRALRRIQPTRSQTQLSRERRAANVRRAFALRRTDAVAGHRVVVVDDVFTTGATTNACARLLKQARARSVCVWTVARGMMH